MRWISSLMIYLGLILVLVCALFLINFGYSGNLSPLSSVFGLGPGSFKTNSSDFWFAMFTESIIVFVTFIVVILFIKLGEEKDRKPVYKEACDDAYHIYEEIYKLVYHIMAYRMKMEMLEPYNEWLKSCESVKNDDTYEIIKSFLEDVHIKDIDVDRKVLENKIDYIYSETENYLQRFGAFLTSEATGSEGSELQRYLNNIRKLFRQLKRSVDSQRIHELLRIKISIEKSTICLGSDSETIDVPCTITENMKDRHPELKKFIEKSGIVRRPEWIDSRWIEFAKKKCAVNTKRTDEGDWIIDGKWIHEWSDDGINITVNLGFLTMKYFMNELSGDELYGVDSDRINRDDCILAWATLFEKFKESCDRCDTSSENAEFDFWCMYWDYRHRLLEGVKTKCKKNRLNYEIPKNRQNTRNELKGLAKAIRKERKLRDDSTKGDQRQDCNRGIFELLDVCNNDKKARDAFRKMKGSSDDGK